MCTWHVHMPPLAYAVPAIYTHISLPISFPKVLISSLLSRSLALRIWKKNTVYGAKTTSPHHHIFILSHSQLAQCLLMDCI